MNVSFRSTQQSSAASVVSPTRTNTYTTNVNNTLATKNVNPNSVLLDKNYGILQARSMKVNFKGLPPANVVSLAQKIQGSLDLAGQNDIVLVSKDIQSGMKQAEKYMDAFSNVIKRVFFVKDEKADHPAAFFNRGIDKMYVNLHDDNVLLKDEVQDKSFFVDPGDPTYIAPTDRIFITQDGVKLDTNTSFLPTAMKKNYSMPLDLQDATEQPIKNLNKNIFHAINSKINPNSGNKKIMFSDVGGQDKVIRDLKELVVDPIKHPEVAGSKSMNHNVILVGPPGTGKSLLMEATANESGVNFVYKKGSEFEGSLVGETEKNMREFFDDLRENQPVVVGLDEFDAMAKKRGGQDVYGDKALNTFLGLMSESEKRGDKIYIIAASNNEKSFDAAVTRSGRFSKEIFVGLPDLKGTKQILDIHTKGEPLDENVDKEKLAKDLHKIKATGADIAAMVEDSERFAKRREKIYEKIDKGTYKPSDMKNLRIKQEDINKSFAELKTKKEQENNQTTPADELKEQIDEYKALNKERREEIEKFKKSQVAPSNRPQVGFNSDRYKDQPSVDKTKDTKKNDDKKD